MKKSIKKMFKRTLIGSTVLMGILVSGGNPASADTNSDVNKILKDSNGNPIVYGQDYYMEPYEHPGYRFGFVAIDGWRSLGLANSLDNTYDNSIRFQKSASQDEYPESVDIQINQHQNSFYIMPVPDELWAATGSGNYEGSSWRKLRTWVPKEPSVDMNSDLATGNYYAFKNPYERKSIVVATNTEVISPPAFLSHTGIGKKVIPNTTMDLKAMWRLIPKQ
ncbi:hypothetical protein [Bacillus cereus]|uniref:hypothetical protein n=1 Tax=Bacillus cereus TaxID=1396 RepID=UPI000279CD7F|nr:hypothetical protein [Bacillus cereus]EJR90723.1 hypothetical protein IKG_05917 [Bacillus cereus VD200]